MARSTFLRGVRSDIFGQDAHDAKEQQTSCVSCACCSAELFWAAQKKAYREGFYTNPVSAFLPVQCAENQSVEELVRKDTTYAPYSCSGGSRVLLSGSKRLTSSPKVREQKVQVVHEVISACYDHFWK